MPEETQRRKLSTLGDDVLNNDDFAAYDLDKSGSVSSEEYLTVETQKRR